MEVAANSVIRPQLVDRREKLRAALAVTGERPELRKLLQEVDQALDRLETGTYGRCDVCREPIEPERLIADPLVRFCLDHLTADEQRALELDLQLAVRIQRGLLPDQRMAIDGWEIAYHYQPARLVSGDYCDVVPSADGGFYFFLGDVSGKGVAASMLMAHLHALFRTLVSLELPLSTIMERASHAFCESTLPTHYATLISGHARPLGTVELCNAGHLPAILSTASETSFLAGSDLPLGMFCTEQFKVHDVRLHPGDLMALVTDGMTETEDMTGAEYGIDRVASLVERHRTAPIAQFVTECRQAVETYGGQRQFSDDLTILAIRRA